jgi:hypothetical protein
MKVVRRSAEQVNREDAPAEWFHDCGEGRARRCLKTPYFDRVDLPDQCVTHAEMRQKGTEPPAERLQRAQPAPPTRGAVTDETLQAELRLYGRTLGLLERNGYHPLPPRLRKTP